MPNRMRKVPPSKGHSSSSGLSPASQKCLSLVACFCGLIALAVFLSGGARRDEAASSSSSSTHKKIHPHYSYDHQVRQGGNSPIRIKVVGGGESPKNPKKIDEKNDGGVKEVVVNDDDDDDEDFPDVVEDNTVVEPEDTNADDDDDEDDAIQDDDDGETFETAVNGEESENTIENPSLLRTGNTDTATSDAVTSTTANTQQTDPEQIVDVANNRSITKLFAALDKARNAFFGKLKVDYGEAFDELFFVKQTDDQTRRESRGRSIMTSPSGENGPSMERMRRKMIKKILMAQVTGKKIPFVWATGGHSAAAGHGNLYNESYTAILERNGQEIFDAVGLKLIGRNYAMGATTSGMEVASCTKEVFGKDIDVLSWDYGMTDVNRPHRMETYMYRAFANENRPACIGLNVGLSKNWIEVMKSLEERGMTVLYKDERVGRAIESFIPDTLGKSQVEIDAMPTFLRSYKCGNSEKESGEPTCSLEKFTDTHDVDCEKRKYRVSWHPGWKWHALQGNLKTLFLMEVLYDALHEIQAARTKAGEDDMAKHAAVMLLNLQKKEDADYNLYQQSDLPPLAAQKLLHLPDEQQNNEVLSILYKHPNFCHTARLPSESRYRGILTMSNKMGMLDYEKGIELSEAKRSTTFPGNAIPLVYDQNDRQKCYINIEVDYRDYFYLHGNQKADSTLLLPNTAERKVYGTGVPTKGIVALCFFQCDWGSCPKDSINAAETMEGKASFHVNNVPVSNFTLYGETNACYLLMNEERGPYWKANADDQYEIRVRVHDPDMYMRISAFMIW